MGRFFFECPGGRLIYSCANCKTFLSNIESVMSDKFRGATGTAFLFDSVINVYYAGVEMKTMLTGRHLVRDAFCKNCKSRVGWMYEFAYDPTQEYKEGKVILERALIHESAGIDDLAVPNTPMMSTSSSPTTTMMGPPSSSSSSSSSSAATTNDSLRRNASTTSMNSATQAIGHFSGGGGGGPWIPSSTGTGVGGRQGTPPVRFLVRWNNPSSTSSGTGSSPSSTTTASTSPDEQQQQAARGQGQIRFGRRSLRFSRGTGSGGSTSGGSR